MYSLPRRTCMGWPTACISTVHRSVAPRSSNCLTRAVTSFAVAVCTGECTAQTVGEWCSRQAADAHMQSKTAQGNAAHASPVANTHQHNNSPHCHRPAAAPLLRRTREMDVVCRVRSSPPSTVASSPPWTSTRPVGSHTTSSGPLGGRRM